MNKFIVLFFLLFVNETIMADQFDSIFKIAKRAPSSHNAQMWKIKREGFNECTICINDSLNLPQIDPNNRESWISIGSFVENCVGIASDLGYNIVVEKEKKTVLLKIVGEKKKNCKYIPLIKDRRTTRTEFEREKLDDKLLHYDNCLYVSRLTEQGKKVADNIYYANKQQIENNKKAEELSKWMITSYNELRNRKDGLTPNMLGLYGLKKILFLSLFNKRSIQTLRFEKQYLSSTKKQINNCSGFLILFSRKNSTEDDWFNTGRELERIWLDLTHRQIAVHPMSQSIEELNYYNKLEHILESCDKDIQMILRIGYSKSPLGEKPCSKRRDL